ncbi:hypothetical protein ABIC85_001960 [Oerskovia enterophila]
MTVAVAVTVTVTVAVAFTVAFSVPSADARRARGPFPVT